MRKSERPRGGAGGGGGGGATNVSFSPSSSIGGSGPLGRTRTVGTSDEVGASDGGADAVAIVAAPAASGPGTAAPDAETAARSAFERSRLARASTTTPAMRAATSSGPLSGRSIQNASNAGAAASSRMQAMTIAAQPRTFSCLSGGSPPRSMRPSSRGTTAAVAT